MKKLISAASAMVMAASMVGSAVPFATGAAEASKGVELRAYLNKDGSQASTTINTNDSDVVVPVGVYYIEKETDTRSVRASWCVTSADGDASKVKFTEIYAPNAPYFTSAQTVTAADGTTADLSNLVAFAGTIVSGRAGALFNQSGEYTTIVDDQQASQNVTTAWGTIIWTYPVQQGYYNWAGQASDSFPFYVFDVTFPKGTPAGTYTIDFIDMSDDPEHPDIKTTMIEGEGGTVYTPGAGNLTTKGITITVEGEVVPPTTTAPPATQPATTAPTPTQPATPGNGNEGDYEPSVRPGDEKMGDFIIEGEFKTAKPGETVNVGFIAKANGHKSATMVCELDEVPAGITYEMNDPFNYCFTPIPNWVLSNRTYRSETRAANEDPQDVAEDCVINFDFTLPEDIAPGYYEITFERFHVVEQGKDPTIEGDCTVVAAVIYVEGDIQATTAPVTQAGTTAAPTTPATTTPAPTGDGKVLYGDANDNGKVDIADVVVLNKWLNDNSAYDMTAQGKINADCCDPKAGTPDENDSKAIIRSLVHLNTLPCTAADLG